MSTHGLEVFDGTLETTHVWLNEICDELGPDKHVAWKVLSVVLQKLRERLPLPLAAHLGAQLPLMIRGVYYDQFEPGRLPAERTTREGFIHEVHEALSDTRPVNPEHAIRCVFGVLGRHVSKGQVRKICDALPHGMRQLWSGSDERQPEERVEQARPVEEPLILTEAQQV